MNHKIIRSSMYKNPVLPGFHPDPSICRVGEDYFLVNSSFAYFPGVPLFHSRDLVHWRLIGHCLTRPSQLPLGRTGPSGGIFAPSIRYHDGTFFMITTNVTHGGNFYVTASDPFGEWSDPIWVAQGGIDPSLFFEDRRAYLTSTGVEEGHDPSTRDQGILQSEIDMASGRMLTKPRVIWHGTGGAYSEGPHLYHIGKYYYLMIAEGGTEYGHTEVMARSDSPWGPWESCPHNPILTHRSIHSPIQALGHADMVEAQDGSWWLVCLGFRPVFPQVHHLGRETFLAPVKWDAQGWPHVGMESRLEVSMEAPRLTPVAWATAAERDDFDGTTLGLNWNFLGVPDAEDWSLTRRHSALYLQGKAASLDEGLGTVFVGRRQEHFNCEVAALLDFSPSSEGEQAGLTAWMDPRHHYDLFVSWAQGKRSVGVRRRIGSLFATVAQEALPDGPLTLFIHANRLFYTFGYQIGTDQERILATGETRYLSSEVAGGFTGVYFGLYASGKGQASAAPVFFEWFDYRILEKAGVLSIDSALTELLKHAAAQEVLRRHVPDLVAHPPSDWAANMTLVDLAAMSPEDISPEKIMLINADLRALDVVVTSD
jgi:xylan 1,4-beta-xylosidase